MIKTVCVYKDKGNIPVQWKIVLRPGRQRSCCLRSVIRGGGQGTPYNGLYGEASPEKGAFSGWKFIKAYGFDELKYRRGFSKGLSKYLEQTHLTADSSKYFKGFL